MADKEVYTCRECGAVSEETDDTVTHFAQRSGWALTRRFEQGKMLLEWHCRHCWEKQQRERHAR